MRGGARPLLVWLGVLGLSGIVDAIWTGDLVQIGMVLLAIAMVGGVVVMVVLSGPEALRRGDPGPRGPEVLVRQSAAAVVIAVGLAVLVFGWIFGLSAVLIGAGILAAGGTRLLGEWRAQRRAVRGR